MIEMNGNTVIISILFPDSGIFEYWHIRILGRWGIGTLELEFGTINLFHGYYIFFARPEMCYRFSEFSHMFRPSPGIPSQCVWI